MNRPDKTKFLRPDAGWPLETGLKFKLKTYFLKFKLYFSTKRRTCLLWFR